MKFTFITLFPNIIKGYFGDSILKRAVDNGYIELDYIDPREFTQDRHNRVDRAMVGGGAGMLMMPQPLFSAVEGIKDAHIVVTSPVGKPFRQNDAKRFAKYKHLVLVSGRYEGIDERFIEKCADEVFSIGDFILTGGELASMIIADATARNLKGVLGNSASLNEESFEESILEAPSFTKPTIYREISVPSEFLKGNHAKISDLKNLMAKCKTKYFRPDMYAKLKLSERKQKR